MADTEGEALDVDDPMEDQVEDDQQPSDEGKPEEFDIDFGDGVAPASGDTNLVKHLREQIRERDKRLAEKREPSPEDPGSEPVYGDGSAYGYDEDKWQDDWKTWYDKNQRFQSTRTKAQEQSEQVRQEYEQAEQSYRDKRARLPFAQAEVEEREQVALSSLNEVQRAAIVMVANDAALVFQALGRNPDKLAHISKIQNPVKLAYELAKLEGGLKLMPRRQVTHPEELARGSGSIAMTKGDDPVGDRLYKEGLRKNDMSAFFAHNRAKRTTAGA